MSMFSLIDPGLALDELEEAEERAAETENQGSAWPFIIWCAFCVALILFIIMVHAK